MRVPRASAPWVLDRQKEIRPLLEEKPDLPPPYGAAKSPSAFIAIGAECRVELLQLAATRKTPVRAVGVVVTVQGDKA